MAPLRHLNAKLLCDAKQQPDGFVFSDLCLVPMNRCPAFSKKFSKYVQGRSL